MLSARKQGLGYTPSRGLSTPHDPTSPLPFPDMTSMAADTDVAASEDAASSLAEDEEFAVEENAHRCSSDLKAFSFGVEELGNPEHICMNPWALSAFWPTILQAGEADCRSVHRHLIVIISSDRKSFIWQLC